MPIVNLSNWRKSIFNYIPKQINKGKLKKLISLSLSCSIVLTSAILISPSNMKSAYAKFDLGSIDASTINKAYNVMGSLLGEQISDSVSYRILSNPGGVGQATECKASGKYSSNPTVNQPYKIQCQSVLSGDYLVIPPTFNISGTPSKAGKINKVMVQVAYKWNDADDGFWEKVEPIITMVELNAYEGSTTLGGYGWGDFGSSEFEDYQYSKVETDDVNINVGKTGTGNSNTNDDEIYTSTFNYDDYIKQLTGDNTKTNSSSGNGISSDTINTGGDDYYNSGDSNWMTDDGISNSNSNNSGVDGINLGDYGNGNSDGITNSSYGDSSNSDGRSNYGSSDGLDGAGYSGGSGDYNSSGASNGSGDYNSSGTSNGSGIDFSTNGDGLSGSGSGDGEFSSGLEGDYFGSDGTGEGLNASGDLLGADGVGSILGDGLTDGVDGSYLSANGFGDGAQGYYDADGNWHEGHSPTEGVEGAGWYDANGIWHEGNPSDASYGEYGNGQNSWDYFKNALSSMFGGSVDGGDGSFNGSSFFGSAVNGADGGSSIFNDLLGSIEGSIFGKTPTMSNQQMFESVRGLLKNLGYDINALKNGKNYDPNSAYTEPSKAWDFNRLTKLMKDGSVKIDEKKIENDQDKKTSLSNATTTGSQYMNKGQEPKQNSSETQNQLKEKNK